MNSRLFALRCAAALIFFAAGICAFAQNPGTGSYPYSRLDSFGFDSVNPGNLNVHFAIPIVNKPGRGLPLQYTLEFDGLIWSPASAAGSSAWTPDPSFGLHGYLLNDGYKGYLSYSDFSRKCFDDPNNPGYWEWLETISNFVYHDEFGVDHPFNYQDDQCEQAKNGDGITGNGSSSDGSGFALNVNTFAVLSPSGLQMAIPTYVNGSPLALSANIEDSNGNLVTNDQNGTFTDTMGYSPLSISGSGTPSSPRVFTYSTVGGGTAQITIYYTATSVNTSFGCSGVSEFSQSINLPTSISLPDNSAYQLGYDSAGRLNSVTLPTGGSISYSYSGGVNCADGSPMQLTRSTSVINDGSTQYVKSNVSSIHSHTEVTGPHQDQTEIDFVYSAGTPYETTRSVYSGYLSGGVRLAKTDTCYNGSAPPNCTTQSMSLPVSQMSIYKTIGSVENGSDTYYNSYGLVTDVKEYDYGSGGRGSKLRETTYGYAILGGYLTDRIAAVKQFDGSGNQFSETDYFYDGSQPQATSGLPQHLAVSGPRGNLTSVESFTNSSNALWTVYQVDDTGQLLTASDSNPGSTTFAYDSATDSLLASVTPPAPNGISLATFYTFDPNTGLLTKVTDANGQPTNYYYDSLLRPTETDSADGGKSTMGYARAQGSTLMHSSANVYQNNTTPTDVETQYDPLGRQARVAVGNGQGSNPWYQSDVCLNQAALTSFTSYQYQGNEWSSSPVCSGTGGDLTSYDPLGRAIQVTHGDSSSIHYSYAGRATQVTDENQVSRITQVDGLGRVTAVCEISSNGSMPGSGQPVNCGLDLSGTGFLTTYAYDTLNHKVTVTQGVQQRVFQTDWMGRPTFSQEPEAGQTTYSYTYNSTGLQVSQVRPKGNQTNPSVTTTATTQFDALGRVLSISYTDGTPTKNYFYDQSAGWGTSYPQNYMKGRLSEAYISNTAATIFGYDQVGRTVLMGECTPSTCGASAYLFNYSFDKTGNLLTAGDGFGVTTTYTYTPANEVSSITSSLNDSTHPQNLVSNIKNGPYGPSNWQLGNGLCGARQYDSMGRITGGGVYSGSTPPNCSSGSQLYAFSSGWFGGYLTSSSDSALGQNSTYTYDEFSRLSARNVNSGNPGSFTYSYDRWGNRVAQTVVSGSGPQPNYSFSNNKIQGGTCSPPTSSQICYDAAGNEITDGTNTYSYDAEGNVIQEGSTAFTYDALNQQVRQNYGSVASEVLFGANGQLASLLWAGGSQIMGKAYWGGMPIESYQVSANQAYYQHFDWNLNKRLTTTYSGAVKGEHAELPFGDGYQNVTGSRDNTFDDFGGLWDNGTTMHAQYREYNDTSGRWMSPDPYGGSYNFANPQSLNRYAYAGNDPMTTTDSAGLDDCNGLSCFGDGGGGGGDGGDGWGCEDGFSCDPGGCDPIFYNCDGSGDGEGGGAIGSPQPEFKGYDGLDLDPNHVMNESLGLPAGMRLPTGGILDIFGISQGCEFGACGSVVFDATDGQGQSAPNLSSYYQPLPPLQLPIGPILSSVRSTPGPPKPKKYSGWDWWSRYGSQIICELSSSTAGDNVELFLGGTITGSGLLVYGPTWKTKAAGVPFILATWAKAADIRSQCVSGIWGPGYH